MNKEAHDPEYARKQTKHFFAGPWRGRLLGARVRRPLTSIMTLFTLAALLFATVLFTKVGDAWARPLRQTAPALGTAANFAVLGGSTVTNIGLTIVTGDLGVSPGTAITGFPPGVVSGTLHANDAVAAQAQADTTVAYNNLAGQACNTTLTGQDLGGLTLTAGVYCFSASAQLTGALTLDAQGNPDAVFVFQIGSTLTTASAASVLLINGASSCNVFWQVGSSATLGTDTTFVGNVLALASITLNTNAGVSGRALAQNGAVTMDANAITLASCAVAPPTPTATSTSTNTPVVTNTSTPTATGTNTPVATNTSTPTATGTNMPVATNTSTPTATGTLQPIATGTLTPTATETPSVTPTMTTVPSGLDPVDEPSISPMSKGYLPLVSK